MGRLANLSFLQGDIFRIIRAAQ